MNTPGSCGWSKVKFVLDLLQFVIIEETTQISRERERERAPAEDGTQLCNYCLLISQEIKRGTKHQIWVPNSQKPYLQQLTSTN